ncbi:MAG: tetratricopeptide repeat protein [Anaerolineae bacterium]|nr:tetratricopeptide repeat protein [Anaerolineae bacterium]
MSDPQRSTLISKALAVREQVIARHLAGKLVYEQDLAALAHEIIAMTRLDETFAVGQLFNAMGVIEFDRGHFIAAYDYITSALHSFQAINNQERMISALNNLGEIHRQWGKHAAALDYFRRANEMAQALENWELVALLASNAGLVYLDQVKPQQALEHFQRSLDISSRVVPRPDTESETYSAMARAFIMLGEFERAWNAAEQALRISQKHNRVQDTAFACRTLGKLAAAQPERGIAPESYFNQSREICLASGAQADYALTLLDEAEWRAASNERETASALLTEARQIFTEAKMADEAARARLLLAQLNTGG